jgi:hypothetical protein
MFLVGTKPRVRLKLNVPIGNQTQCLVQVPTLCYVTVSNTRFLLNSRFPFTDSRFPLTDSRFPVTDSRFPLTDSRFPLTDSRFPLTDSRFPVIGWWVPGYRLGGSRL